MEITPETVRRVAALARLDLDPREMVELARQLGGILEHMDALAGIDAEAPGAGAEREPQPEPADRGAPLRADVPGPDALTRPLAELAPAWSDGFFTVPRLESHGPGDEDGP